MKEYIQETCVVMLICLWYANVKEVGLKGMVVFFYSSSRVVGMA